MGSRRLFGREKGEKSPSSKSNKVVLGVGALLLAGGAGFWAGNENGQAEGVEDCTQSFGPDKILTVGPAHPLSAGQVQAMIRLARSDAKPVSFHTSGEDLEAVGLEPILDDLDRGKIISVSIPEEVTVSGDTQAAINDALAVGNILKSWSDDSDSVVKLTPEGTQQEVDPGTEVLVQIQTYNC